MNVIFIGSKLIGFRCLRKCEEVAPGKIRGILTIDDSGDSRSALSDFSSFSKERRIPLRYYHKSSDLDEFIAENKGELCVVVGWYWIIRKELLYKVPHGFVGLHASLLPKYRGGSPLVWAIINGENKTGVSMFYLSEGLDDGDLIGSSKFIIEEKDTIREVSEKAIKCSTNILKEHYPKLLRGDAIKTKQDRQGVSYCGQRIPDDGKINWNWTAHRIYNFIRAQSHPYPGAFTVLGDQKLTIWSASLLKETCYGTPGQVARISPDGVTVVCGDDKAIILKTLQLGSSTACMASEIIKTYTTRFK